MMDGQVGGLSYEGKTGEMRQDHLASPSKEDTDTDHGGREMNLGPGPRPYARAQRKPNRIPLGGVPDDNFDPELGSIDTNRRVGKFNNNKTSQPKYDQRRSTGGGKSIRVDPGGSTKGFANKHALNLPGQRKGSLGGGEQTGICRTIGKFINARHLLSLYYHQVVSTMQEEMQAVWIELELDLAAGLDWC